MTEYLKELNKNHEIIFSFIRNHFYRTNLRKVGELEGDAEGKQSVLEKSITSSNNRDEG